MWNKPWWMLTCQGHCPTLASLPEAMLDETAGHPQTASEEEKSMGDPPQNPPSAPSAPCSFLKLESSLCLGPPGMLPLAGVPYFTLRDSLVPLHLCLGREKGEGGRHP